MKKSFTIILIFISFASLAQERLPIVKATSTQAKIYVSNHLTKGWNISPKIKLDIYKTGKLTKSERVTFKTDIDSINFKIKPACQKDFIVLLNSKDSCFTRIQSPEIKNFSKLTPEIHDSIPFFLNKYNTNFVKVVFNQTDSLVLNFDTGATEIDFTTDALKTKVKSNPKLYNKAYELKVGNRTYKSEVYDINLSGNETDGLLGWNMFDGMIVELDYDNHKMVLHSKMPSCIFNDKNYSKFKLHYISNKPFIESTIVQSGIKNKSWFLFDLGYKRTVMLDNDLLRANGFPSEKMEVLKKVIMHGSRGAEFPVTTANLQTLKLGPYKLKNVPTQLLTQNKPIKGMNIHILGTDILKRFNTVLDFQNNVIYLKPNHLYETEYTDQKKATYNK